MAWWDGPESFQNLNRNLVSAIQKDAIFRLVKGLCSRNAEHASFGIDVGGPGGPEMNSLGLDLQASPAHNAVVGDGACLPFQDNSLDYITSIASIEHIQGDPIDIFQEWVRALRIGGIIVCFAPLLEHFSHSNETEIKLEFQAPNEYVTEDWEKIVKQIKNVKIVQLNSIKNNMYAVIVLLKIR